MVNSVSIFEDADYLKLRQRIANIETVEEAVRLLEGIITTHELSLWAVVDILHHFQENHIRQLPDIEVALEKAFGYDRSRISQLKKVATVFGDVSKRFPALSFSIHVQLAYATAYLEWDEIVRVAKEAELNMWSYQEVYYRLNQLRREKLLKQMEKGEEIQKRRGRPPAALKEAETILHETEEELEVDIRKSVEIKEQAKEEEKKRHLTGVAIQAADAYARYGAEFIDYLLEAMSIRQWEFFWKMAVKMKDRLPMLTTCQYPKEEICSTLHHLLDLILAYEIREEENVIDEVEETDEAI